MTNLSKLGLTLTLAAMLSACSTSPTGRSQLMLVSPSQAINASKAAYTQMLAPLKDEGKVDTDAELVKRVQTIAGRIVYQAIERFPNTRNWDWSISVIDDPETVNAWCMAGGRMAIYTGLIEKLNPTDDELAQVIGHEVSHALANHTAERMSVAMATQLGMVALSVATENSEYRNLALTGAPLAAAVAITLPNSRTGELEADRLGMELAARAGYNPEAAATLWQKMGANSKGAPPEFISTHPAPGNRQQTLANLAPQMLQLYNPNAPTRVYSFK
jgi:predicted Zn-dependent protease